MNSPRLSIIRTVFEFKLEANKIEQCIRQMDTQWIPENVI